MSVQPDDGFTDNIFSLLYNRSWIGKIEGGNSSTRRSRLLANWKGKTGCFYIRRLEEVLAHQKHDENHTRKAGKVNMGRRKGGTK